MIFQRFPKTPTQLNFIFSLNFPRKKLIHTGVLLTHLKKCPNLVSLQSLQASMIKTDLIQDCYLMNNFITSCFSLNQIEYANSIFTQMKSPNVFVYNALIRGLIRSGRSMEALELYLVMLRDGVYPTSYTFSPIIKACGQVYAARFGEGIHCQAWKNGFDTHVFVLTSLVDLYGKLKKFDEACKVFDEMPERDLFAWITMVCVYARGGDMGSARRLFDEMPERNVTAWNAMIDGYSRVGNVEGAALLFDQMPGKDLISWTSMIACYSQNKEYKRALAVFDEMIKSGVHPDEMTLATIISCCAHLGALDLGKKLHFYIVREGFSIDVYIGSALIDMYAKCGRLDRSLIVFFNLREKNLFCWNSIIEGLATHGHGRSALEMFETMLKTNIKPNGVTFISVLSACTHAGFVDKGRELFRSMIDDFQINPQVEHYGCMVDLLCKARLLEDAMDVIKRMKIKPNAVVWGALLNGCKLCLNLEMAELAVSNLMELEPENCGYYTLLANMYAEANQWKEVAKIRAIIRELGIEKQCPGSSWIEMGNEVHQFVAADKSHSASTEIHLLLDNLYWQLKLNTCPLEVECAL
ncbi:pentatricopeptide repeat-containing protein At1g06143 [Silene latifolia]|uniref:pentatricopeptide repeat-containing protein At1g06143 n=1 Tax=Silene latifolia TaxID=37657 RepID=UPI003D7854B7